MILDVSSSGDDAPYPDELCHDVSRLVGRSAMGLGCVKKRRRGKLREEISARITIRAMTISERGSILSDLIIRKHSLGFGAWEVFTQPGSGMAQHKPAARIEKLCRDGWSGKCQKKTFPCSLRNRSRGHYGRRRPVATIGPQNVGGVSQDFSVRWTAFRCH
jgi:hypothetical protein